MRDEQFEEKAEKAIRVLTANREELFTVYNTPRDDDGDPSRSIMMNGDGYSIYISFRPYPWAGAGIISAYFMPEVEYRKAFPETVLNEISDCVRRLRAALNDNVHFTFSRFTALLVNRQG